MKELRPLVAFAIIILLHGVAIAAEDAKTYLNKGVEFEKKNDTVNAVACYNKAITIDPNSKEAYEHLVAIYIALATLKISTELNLKEAMDYYDKAIKNESQLIRIEPKNPKYYINRGLIFNLRGAPVRAIEDFNQAIYLDPQNVSAYKARAISYRLNKQYDKSWEDVNKARSMGGKIDEKFLEKLKKDSGREN